MARNGLSPVMFFISLALCFRSSPTTEGLKQVLQGLKWKSTLPVVFLNCCQLSFPPAIGCLDFSVGERKSICYHFIFYFSSLPIALKIAGYCYSVWCQSPPSPPPTYGGTGESNFIVAPGPGDVKRRVKHWGTCMHDPAFFSSRKKNCGETLLLSRGVINIVTVDLQKFDLFRFSRTNCNPRQKYLVHLAETSRKYFDEVFWGQ